MIKKSDLLAVNSTMLAKMKGAKTVADSLEIAKKFTDALLSYKGGATGFRDAYSNLIDWKKVDEVQAEAKAEYKAQAQAERETKAEHKAQAKDTKKSTKGAGLDADTKALLAALLAKLA